MPRAALRRNVERAVGHTVLAGTFELDVTCCVRCGGCLDVRAVVTDLDTASKILDAMPATAGAPPSNDASLVHEPA